MDELRYFTPVTLVEFLFAPSVHYPVGVRTGGLHASGVCGEEAALHRFYTLDGTLTTLPAPNGRATTLLIWTEYQPLRYLLERFRQCGGRALVATSANKAGEPTHWQFSLLRRDFGADVDAMVEADFSQLSEDRRKSTSIIDLTGDAPRFHRAGNVSELEIDEALVRNRLPGLRIAGEVIQVRAR